MSVNVSGNGSNSKHQRLSTAQTVQADAVKRINAQPVLLSRQSGCLVRVSCLIARMTLLHTQNCNISSCNGLQLKGCTQMQLSLLHYCVRGHKA